MHHISLPTVRNFAMLIQSLADCLNDSKVLKRYSVTNSESVVGFNKRNIPEITCNGSGFQAGKAESSWKLSGFSEAIGAIAKVRAALGFHEGRTDAPAHVFLLDADNVQTLCTLAHFLGLAAGVCDVVEVTWPSVYRGQTWTSWKRGQQISFSIGMNVVSGFSELPHVMARGVCGEEIRSAHIADCADSVLLALERLAGLLMYEEKRALKEAADPDYFAMAARQSDSAGPVVTVAVDETPVAGTLEETKPAGSLSISIERMEGPKSDCRTTTHATWTEANARLAEISATVEGCDKVRVRIVWPDGEEFSDRIDVKRGEKLNLGGKVESWMTYLAGRSKPRHAMMSEYRKLVERENKIEEALKFLDGRPLDDFGRTSQAASLPLAWETGTVVALAHKNKGAFHVPPVGARLVAINGPIGMKFGTIIASDPIAIRGRVEVIQRAMWDDGTAYRVTHIRLYSDKFGIGIYWDEFAALADQEEVNNLLTAADAKEAKDRKEREEAAAKSQAAEEAGKAIASALIPADCPALIVAELRQDKSDSQTDYYGSEVVETVVLATSTHTRDVFSEMRKAAACLPELAGILAHGTEHREKYSMGRGYYLSESGCGHSGWQVRKVCKFKSWDHQIVASLAKRHTLDAPVLVPAPVVAPVEPAPAPASASAVVETAPIADVPMTTVEVAPALLVWSPEPGKQSATLRAVGLSVAELRAAGFAWTWLDKSDRAKGCAWISSHSEAAAALLERICSTCPAPSTR